MPAGHGEGRCRPRPGSFERGHTDGAGAVAKFNRPHGLQVARRTRGASLLQLLSATQARYTRLLRGAWHVAGITAPRRASPRTTPHRAAPRTAPRAVEVRRALHRGLRQPPDPPPQHGLQARHHGRRRGPQGEQAAVCVGPEESGRRQPFIALCPQECMGQLASCAAA